MNETSVNKIKITDEDGDDLTLRRRPVGDGLEVVASSYKGGEIPVVVVNLDAVDKAALRRWLVVDGASEPADRTTDGPARPPFDYPDDLELDAAVEEFDAGGDDIALALECAAQAYQGSRMPHARMIAFADDALGWLRERRAEADTDA